jgi:BirA family biotin operon repressor/biotin-[acetyl-CoA-carboxylase] ligase
MIMEPFLDGNSLHGIETSIIGRDVEFLGEVTSTNILARERAEKGCREGLVLVASSQTSGKGRLDREFHSPEGGLYLSIVLKPKILPSQSGIIPLMAGLAVSKAISTTVMRETSLKWPNDVMMDGKKICGILNQAAVKGEGVEYLIIGIGINVNSTLEQLPDKIQGSAGTLKELTSKEIDMKDLFRNLICFLDMLYLQFLSGDISTILDSWSERSSTVGKHVKVRSGSNIIEGKALGLDQSGALLLGTENSLQRVEVGDVEHLE